MSLYQDLKYAISDGVCYAAQGVTPEGFAAYCPRYIDGFLVTLELLLLSSALGLSIGTLVAVARVSRQRALRTAAWAWSYVFRGTPLLVQLWIVYYGLGSLGPEKLGILWPFFKSGWAVGLAVLTINTSAYIAEILRGGIGTLPPGQLEAALSCGMSRGMAMRRILLPQAFRVAWPAYGNELILLMKGSALVSTITVMDLMGQTRSVFARGYSLETYMYSAVLYALLALLLTAGLRAVEKRLRVA
ncbi:ABC transporter permease subunit [Sedimentimonas flavescens]|uniref:ABC transporter permease subunit n=1 Tax=Sedimentimonas flavescens TaxID=2851012 RepID=UPI001C4A66E8|nr:ABC transporter permease subunit [Sedimentimonas flavescens]MBW0157514.1 ABC transporter permease subunit [Sedimentimonas flavescens]WBL34173.1 ABC transporter permease subunit [Sinirhodobacter sp. HNIBRBA609]